MPNPDTVDAVTRGAHDPNDLGPNPRELKDGISWNSARKKFSSLKPTHQQRIKPFAIQPVSSSPAFVSRGWPNPSKRYDPKEIEKLAELVMSEAQRHHTPAPVSTSTTSARNRNSTRAIANLATPGRPSSSSARARTVTDRPWTPPSRKLKKRTKLEIDDESEDEHQQPDIRDVPFPDQIESPSPSKRTKMLPHLRVHAKDMDADSDVELVAISSVRGIVSLCCYIS